METVEFWRGSFGQEYTKRNRPNWRDRVPFWERIIERTNAQSVLDVGCNVGWNLLALRSFSDIPMTGIDVNPLALLEAQTHGLDVAEGRADQVAEYFGAGAADLVVTSGVLIHIAPDDLMASMTAIRDASSQYVLAVEYEAQDETEVDYRGHKGRLWKRDYGGLYESIGLSLVEYGPAQGFDRCMFWLLEK